MLSECAEEGGGRELESRGVEVSHYYAAEMTRTHGRESSSGVTRSYSVPGGVALSCSESLELSVGKAKCGG